MKKLIALTAIASAALMASSCTKSDPTEAEATPPAGQASGDTVESLAKETQTKMLAFADAMASAKDKATAEKAATEITAIGNELVAISKRLSKLEKPSKEARKAMSEDMNAMEEEIGKKMGAAMGVMMGNEEVSEIIGKAMEGFQGQMEEAGKIFETYFDAEDEAPPMPTPVEMTPPVPAPVEVTPPTPPVPAPAPSNP